MNAIFVNADGCGTQGGEIDKAGKWRLIFQNFGSISFMEPGNGYLRILTKSKAEMDFKPEFIVSQENGTGVFLFERTPWYQFGRSPGVSFETRNGP